MTFCVGIKVREGLVGIADTRVTSGNEIIMAKKVNAYEVGGWPLFLMTSGLRSVRDKALTYFEDEVARGQRKFDKLYKAVNAFAEQIRTVAAEDGAALKAGGLKFNIHCLMGGQMRNDSEHRLYLIYPEGNWVEVNPGTPYSIIGSSRYGKPVLDRTLTFEDTMRFALKVGCLAFDSTRISAADVNFPIDIVLYRTGSRGFIERRFMKEDLESNTRWWQERLREAVRELPDEWTDSLFERLQARNGAAKAKPRKRTKA